MGQFIRIVIILFGVWLVLGIVRRALARRRPDRGIAPPASVAEILPCAHCGVHVPRRQAITHGGRIYCSEEHRLAGPKK
ncbi:MAG: hypothetical protein A2V92_02960 [Candidatus Muproteobacteria bacterium RBG_16_65_31]|uniref:Uncharacterized protein n=1 Tax=Candidatus Muproteobacteria bacterium RBG_16_65_31 TaxID=1817759 RepID=A0A1F6THM8_9PROT|nr:MAG: hypothetical protein A2V92_02960 [Candidatus Muproteobacteria bacterium RBG_16_65_31]